MYLRMIQCPRAFCDLPRCTYGLLLNRELNFVGYQAVEQEMVKHSQPFFGQRKPRQSAGFSCVDRFCLTDNQTYATLKIPLRE